jgi:hypothetical protein
LRVEVYFQHVRDVIEACPLVQSFDIADDKRGTHEGFIRGELHFVDGSVLHLREFVDVETTIDRLMYVYQYRDATKTLVFRYDNTGHHQKLDLPTYPHYKHDGREGTVVSSSAPTLAEVLNEIEGLVPLP